MRRRAGKERELVNRVDQRDGLRIREMVCGSERWFVDERDGLDWWREWMSMSRRVLMAEVNDVWVRVRPRLGWMDGVKVVFGSRGMTVEDR